jgi:hypothetical protein
MAASTRARAQHPDLTWRVHRCSLLGLCLAVVACSAPLSDDAGPVLLDQPEWTTEQPHSDGDHWIAVGSGAATSVEQAELLAVEAARARLLALRGFGHADDLDAPGEADLLTARLARLGSSDTLNLVLLADGERFVHRLEDGSVESFVQVSVEDIELFPRRRLQEAAGLQDGPERARGLIDLARKFLLRGMDAHSHLALEFVEQDTALAPSDLMELASLHSLLGRPDDALRVTARALELLQETPEDEALLARAREQRDRLVSGIVSIEDCLLDLERLTRATRRDDLLRVSRSEVRCEAAQASSVQLDLGSNVGRLAPLWIDVHGVRLVNLSDGGRVSTDSLEMSVGLAPGVDTATLLVWLLPEDQSVLEMVDSLRNEQLPSDDLAASDEHRLQLQSLLEGLRRAAADPGVGAAMVRLYR